MNAFPISWISIAEKGCHQERIKPSGQFVQLVVLAVQQGQMGEREVFQWAQVLGLEKEDGVVGTSRGGKSSARLS